MIKPVFSDSDFNSDNGMLTKVWGPPLWYFLHTISFNYPIKPTYENQKNYYNFFFNLKYILPCKYCRENLKKNFKETKFSLKVFKNRETLSKWVYNLHNHINTMLGKEKYSSYNEVRESYENFRSRCSLKNNKKKCLRNLVIKHNNKKEIKEKGCITPLYGIKSKCCLTFVPATSKKETMKIDKRCLVKKIYI